MIYLYGRMKEGFREFSWSYVGTWQGGGPDPELPRPFLSKDTKHQGCCPDACGRFICPWCRRVVPWCVGGHAGTDVVGDKLCSDCWDERRKYGKSKDREEVRAELGG